MKKKEEANLAWWAAFSAAMALILLPEPVTTAAGTTAGIALLTGAVAAGLVD